jgi:hypothetical protein
VLIRSTDDIVPELEYLNSIKGPIKNLLSTDAPDILVILDVICLIFFTIEFVFRLFVSPRFRKSLKSWHTLIEVLYLFPAWTKLLIDLTVPFFWQQGWKNATFLLALDAMILLRVFRIFSLLRHYRGLWVLLLAIKSSVSELILLALFVIISLTIFSVIVFYAEQLSMNQSSGSEIIHNAFYGLWWAIVTLTTVGYGDVYPLTIVGRIFACFCSFTGLLIISMLVPIIAGNLHLYYGFRHAGNRVCKNKKPEFVPPELENPLPDLVQESFIPLKRIRSLNPGNFERSKSEYQTRLKKVSVTTSYI